MAKYAPVVLFALSCFAQDDLNERRADDLNEMAPEEGRTVTKEDAEMKIAAVAGNPLPSSTAPGWSMSTPVRYYVIDHPTTSGHLLVSILMDNLPLATAWQQQNAGLLPQLTMFIKDTLKVDQDRIIQQGFSMNLDSRIVAAMNVASENATALMTQSFFQFEVTDPSYVKIPGDELNAALLPPTPAPQDDDESFPLWAIILCAVGGPVLIAACAALFCMQKRANPLPLHEQIKELQDIAELEASAKGQQPIGF